MLAICLLLSVALAGGIPELVASGDDAFVRIDYPAALQQYRAALGENPKDPAVLWRLARTYVCLAEVSDQPVRDSLLAEGARCARQCIEVDSLAAAGHTWLAGALGYQALEAGMSEQILLSQELHREAQRAIELDPRDDAAYSILGSFYRALGNAGWLKRTLASLFVGSIPAGGFEESEAMLKRAVELAPDVMRHKYELGILYLDMGREDQAREVLEEGALLPVRTAIDRPRLAKIREILSSMAPDK